MSGPVAPLRAGVAVVDITPPPVVGWMSARKNAAHSAERPMRATHSSRFARPTFRSTNRIAGIARMRIDSARKWLKRFSPSRVSCCPLLLRPC